MALQGWDKNYREELKIQQEVIESLQQQLMIAGEGGAPGQPYTPPKEDPKNPYVPAPGRKLAANNIVPTKGPLAPNDDDYGEGEIEGYPGWKLAAGPQLPNFKPMGRVIKGTRKGVLSPEENKIKQQLQIGPQAMDYPPPSELDRWLQLYQRNGGSLRHLDPDMRRLILQRGAMKADAANNIRSLQSTGHQTVLDDNRPGKLKIIKQFRPPRA
tara:strand:- start:73 stop:711 length:639 start_codon:yes stop_codon:yes gene_type:complete